MTFNCLYPGGASWNDDMCMAFSKDGIHWAHQGTKFRSLRADTQICLYHDQEDKYEMIMRQEFPTKEFHRAIRGTAVLSISRSDFNRGFLPGAKSLWLSTVNRMYLGRYGTLEMYRRQMYALTRTKYEGVYFGFLHLYEWAYPDLGCPRSKTREQPCNTPLWNKLKDGIVRPDTVRPYLITSRDGSHYNFEWVYAEMPWQLGQLADDGFVMPANNMVTRDGYHHVFFSRNPLQHWERWEHSDEIRLARFPQDRIIGVERDPKAVSPGWIRTHSFDLHDDVARLVFNVHIPSTGADDLASLAPSSSFSVSLGSLSSGGSEPLKLGTWTTPCEQISVSLDAFLAQGKPKDAVWLELQLAGGAQLYAVTLESSSTS